MTKYKRKLGAHKCKSIIFLDNLRLICSPDSKQTDQ